MATYTCDTGYTLNGGITRTCESDGMWSGSPPTCRGTVLIKEYTAIMLMVDTALMHSHLS